MRYAQAREHIETGDLIVFGGRRLADWLIRFRTSSGYSHVGIAMWQSFPRANERLWLVESEIGRGLQQRALSMCLPFYHVSKPDGWSWTLEAEQWVIGRLGRSSYDSLAVMRAALGIEMKQDERFTCNEAVGEIAHRMGASRETMPQSPAQAVSFWLRQPGAKLVTVSP